MLLVILVIQIGKASWPIGQEMRLWTLLVLGNLAALQALDEIPHSVPESRTAISQNRIHANLSAVHVAKNATLRDEVHGTHMKLQEEAATGRALKDDLSFDLPPLPPLGIFKKSLKTTKVSSKPLNPRLKHSSTFSNINDPSVPAATTRDNTCCLCMYVLHRFLPIKTKVK